MSTLLENIASDEVIDTAYRWLCKKRQHYHPNADVWQVRRWWHEKKPILQAQILSGNFHFRELRLIRGEKKTIEWWSSLDALVLKAMTIVLSEHLKPVLSPRCFHLAGTGGLKGAVRCKITLTSAPNSQSTSAPNSHSLRHRIHAHFGR